jgi:type II secretory pathway pseudopilin PulG
MYKLSFKSLAKYAVLMSSISAFFFATTKAQAQQQEQQQQSQTQSVVQQLQQLKKEVISLNRDLFVLEEDLLFPSSTQVALYLSMDVGTYFDLDSVELKIDGQTVTHYLYTDKQTNALYRGGVQRLHVDNVAQGEHQISAFFTGTGPQNRSYKRATFFTFNKESDAKALELSIVDSSTKQQPEFTVVEL